MGAAQLQEEAGLRARLAQLESEVSRLRRNLERAGISPDATAPQVAEMMPKREHLTIVAELRRVNRAIKEELTRERARNLALLDMHSSDDDPNGPKDISTRNEWPISTRSTS